MRLGKLAAARALKVSLLIADYGECHNPYGRGAKNNGAGALHRMREGRAGGGGAIDLVQYLKDIGFREAVRELGGLASSRESFGPVTAKPASSRCSHRMLPPSSQSRKDVGGNLGDNEQSQNVSELLPQGTQRKSKAFPCVPLCPLWLEFRL